MVDSDWLDIAIGVVFVWFLLALIVSAVNEGLNRMLAIRAKHLWRALEQMLDGNTPTSSFWGGVLGGLWEVSRWRHRPADPTHPALTDHETEPATATTARLYSTGAVQALESRPGSTQRTRISNIPSGVFAEALIELTMQTPVPALPSGASETKAEALERAISTYIDRLHPDNPFRHELAALYASADGDLNHFRANVESWFDGQMTRLSTLYKKRIRVILIPIGVMVTLLTFAVGMRSDALALVSDLQHDRDLRAGLVDAATRTVSTGESAAGCSNAVPVDDGSGGATSSGSGPASASSDGSGSGVAADAESAAGPARADTTRSGAVAPVAPSGVRSGSASNPTASGSGGASGSGRSGSGAACGSIAGKRIDLAFSELRDRPADDATVGERVGFLFDRSHVYLVDTAHWRAWLGLLITAIALSFGATFWYDVLRRMVGLRSGAKAASS